MSFDEQEVRKSKGEPFTEAFARVMNNFHLHFTQKSIAPDLDPRSCSEDELAAIDGYMAIYAYGGISWDEKEKPGRNRLGVEVGKTPREIHFIIEEVAKRVSDLDRIRKAVKAVQDRPENTNYEPLYKEMWDSILPVFIEMRKMGFSAEFLSA